MRIFKHPYKIGMTYTEHAKLSLHFSYLLAKGSCLAFLHAFIPDIAVTSTSDTIKEIEADIISNKNK